MNVRNLVCPLLVATICFFLHATCSAQIFYTETFDYADGDLQTVSGDLWPFHSGDIDRQIQVESGKAVVEAGGGGGGADHNRLTGVIAGVDDVWYYAVKFSVEQFEMAAVVNEYFIHFKDATTFGFNARLALSAPADMANDFSLQIWASSGGDGMTDWNGDFLFGEEIVCVVRWDNGTGVATLWVNPTDQSSTNVSDDELADAMRAVESVALRQDNDDGYIAMVDAVSVGTSFDAVLEAVCPKTDCDFELGDVNEDGFVNLFDVDPFVAQVASGEFLCQADIDGNGAVDLFDVDPFVALLAGP